MPVDNSAAADGAQRAGLVKHNNYVGNCQGTTFRITEFAPGHARFTHRTETVDYVVVLSGEIDLEFDSGEVVHLKVGDVVVQRGTIHTWVNKGAVPAVTAFILIDAKAVEVDGTEMRTVFRVPDGSQKFRLLNVNHGASIDVFAGHCRKTVSKG